MLVYVLIFKFSITYFCFFKISGQPFWSGPKRCPKPLQFDHNVEQHLDFIVAAANLLAAVHGIEVNRDRDTIADIGKKLVSRKKKKYLACCKKTYTYKTFFLQFLASLWPLSDQKTE